jgi:hypothetical protein
VLALVYEFHGDSGRLVLGQDNITAGRGQ